MLRTHAHRLSEGLEREAWVSCWRWPAHLCGRTALPCLAWREQRAERAEQRHPDFAIPQAPGNPTGSLSFGNFLDVFHYSRAAKRVVSEPSHATETVVTSTQLRAAALLRAAFAPVDRNGACA